MSLVRWQRFPLPHRDYRLAKKTSLAVLPRPNGVQVTQPPGLASAQLDGPGYGPTTPARLAATWETGVSGTTNFRGQLYQEQNLNLINQLAYGQPGTRTWGEWETVIRTDPAVAASLDLVVAPLREAELQVLAGENAEDEKLAQTQADYLRDNLTLWLEPLWVDVCQQVVRGMLGYGFAIQEPVLDTREDDRLPGGFGYYLKKLAQRLPASLEYNAWAEKDDELVAVYQRGLKS